jgi:outer membrane protein W
MAEMKKLAVTMALIAGFLMIGSTAWAGTYLKFNTGLFLPEEDDALDSGYNLGAAFGISLVDVFPGLAAENPAWKNVTAELGTGYRHADGKTTVSAFGTTTTVKTDLDVVPLTLAAIYTYKMPAAPVKFYGGAGPGLYFASKEMKVTTTTIFGTTTVSDDDNELKLGLILKGGALFSLSDRLDLGGELQMDLVSDDIGGICADVCLRYYF